MHPNVLDANESEKYRFLNLNSIERHSLSGCPCILIMLPTSKISSNDVTPDAKEINLFGRKSRFYGSNGIGSRDTRFEKFRSGDR